MRVKIAILIICIALVASIFWLLGLDWLWFCWDIAGAILVSAGCIAEWGLLYGEHGHEDPNRRAEKAWAVVVAIGVTMDVFGLIYGIPEAIRLEASVEDIRSKNLAHEQNIEELRKENDAARTLSWSLETRAANAESKLAEITNNVAKLDPKNANVSELSASAILVVMGPKFNDVTNRDIKGRVAQMTLWDDKKTAAPFNILGATEYTPNEIRVLAGNPNSGNSRIYGIRFNSFNFRSYMGQDTQVKALDDVAFVRMDVMFLAPHSQIWGGGMVVTANNTDAQFQIDTNAAGFGQSGDTFVIIATNVVQRRPK